MHQKLSSITQRLRLPSICALCNQRHEGRQAVCSYCISLIIRLGPSCQSCALPLPGINHFICGQCIKRPPPVTRTFVAYTFEEPLRGLIHDFKYNNGLYLSSVLIQLMLHAIEPDLQHTQCLIPVPMHPKKVKQRGFNQAVILAKLLSKELAIPMDFHSCEKIKNTLPQANLNGEQRRTNLRRAFKAQKLPYQHVTLVDDLLTTGSTANELALTLKKSGVQQVDLWCCARTIYE